MDILVVGGADSLVKGNLGRKLGDHGVNIGWHVAGKSATLDAIPKSASAVVVVKDMVGHPLSDRATQLAAKANLPIARIPRKWSLAEPVLRTVGILEPAQNGEVLEATPGALVEMAIEYVCDERRRGRVPKKAEVDAALQRAYGPKTQLSNEAFRDIHSKASAQVPLPAHTPSSAEYGTLISAVLEEAAVILAVQPELILDMDVLLNRIRAAVGEDVVVVRQVDLKAQITKAHESMKALWASVPPNSQAMQERNSTIKAWLKRWFEAYTEGNDAYPTQALIRKRSRVIFDRQCRWDWTIEVRAAVFGEWARDLKGTQQVYQKFKEALGMTYDEFLAAIKAGKIKGLNTSEKTWNTSDLAVQLYLNERANESNVKAVIQPVEAPSEAMPEPKRPKQGGTADSPMVSAEDVAVAVGHLIEGEILRRVGETLDPLVKQLADLHTLAAEVNKMREELNGLHSMNASIATSLGSLGEQGRDQRANVDAKFVAVGDAFDEVLDKANRTLERTNAHGDALSKIQLALDEGMGLGVRERAILHKCFDNLPTRDDRIAIERRLDRIDEALADLKAQGGSTGSSDIGLHHLAQMARQTGMKVSIEAGGPPEAIYIPPEAAMAAVRQLRGEEGEDNG